MMIIAADNCQAPGNASCLRQLSEQQLQDVVVALHGGDVNRGAAVALDAAQVCPVVQEALDRLKLRREIKEHGYCVQTRVLWLVVTGDVSAFTAATKNAF